MLIGITGLAGSGKDTVADYLAEKYGMRRLAFADPLREMVSDIDPIVGVLGGEVVRYTDVVERLGYRMTKDTFPEVRRFFDALATGTIRNKVDKDFFVEETMRRVRVGGSAVISDVRFANEKRAIKSFDGGSGIRRGTIIRVIRPGLESLGYESEQIDDYLVDHTVINDGTIEELYERIDQVV